MSSSSLSHEQRGILATELAKIFQSIDEGPIPLAWGVQGLRAVRQEDWMFAARFEPTAGYGWISNEALIIASNLMATCSGMIKAVLPEEFRIIVTFQCQTGKRFFVYKGVPSLESFMRQVNSYIVNYDGEVRIEVSPQYEEDQIVEVDLQELKKQVNLDNLPSETFFLLANGRLIWVEQPKKSKAEYMGECIEILSKFENAIKLEHNHKLINSEIVRTLYDCGYPAGFIEKECSLSYFFNSRWYAITLDAIQWDELLPKLVQLNDKYFKESPT